MDLFGRRFDTGEPVCVRCAGGKIAGIVPAGVASASIASAAGQGGDVLPWLAPAFVDIQINGYGGQEFSSADLDVQRVARIVEAMNPFGVGRFCPTVTTESHAVLAHALRTLSAAWDQVPAVARRMAGIHLEGPFLAREDGPRGAHPRAHCREPDWDEFQRLQQAAGGRIRLLTVSAEYEQSCAFIERVARSGVLVAIGHTSATPAQIHAAAAAGARLSTHLGNGSHPMIPRHNNYLWAQMADDRLQASLIADGHHLPPDVVKCIVRAKGPERCILVSDLSGQAGRPPGRYQGNICEVEILPNGKMVVAGQRSILAGASLGIHGHVLNVMEFAGLPLETAVNLATRHPAALLGLDDVGLAVGCRADLVTFRLPDNTQPEPRALEIVSLAVQGEVVFGPPASSW